MEKLIEQITSTENLLWAWKKAKRAFSIGDIWFSDYKLIEFEANLYNEIESIRNWIKEGSYTLEQLQIVPFPKGFDDIENKPKTRQAFYISVRDQVTWLAVTNVIGKKIDETMPGWSYGNRLYRPAWYEINDNKTKQLTIGNYRNSSGHIFRKWNQSWPLFRKHITATIQIMSNPKYKLEEVDIDEDIQKIIDDNEKVETSQQVPYLLNHYFTHSKLTSIYWASLDLKKFYPNLKCSVIYDLLVSELKLSVTKDKLLIKLLKSLLTFEIDYSNWSDLQLFEIDLNRNKQYEGLPTGLLVAGFLANIALNKIDKGVNSELKSNRNVAHFRFVDDHVILSISFEHLVAWIDKYEILIKSSGTGAIIGNEKTEPKILAEYLEERKNGLNGLNEKAKKACELDPLYPSPLMTQTLAKVSGISKINLNLLTTGELDQLISDLKHLLITDFPDQEVKKETRISFAATMLTKTVRYKELNSSSLYIERKKMSNIVSNLKNKDQFEIERKINVELLIEFLNEFIHKDFLTVKSINEYSHKLRSFDNILQVDGTNDILLNSFAVITDDFKIIENKQNKLNSEVYNLLYKAIKENHQKVRLWIRLMEFCYNQGFSKFKQIWELADILSRDNILHKLSAPFIYYLLIAQIVKFSWTSTRAITSNNITEEDKYKHTEFLKSILSDDFIKLLFDKELECTEEYYKSIYTELRVLVGSIPFILNLQESKKFNEFNILSWNNNPQAWMSSLEFDTNINVWIYWILNNTHNSIENKPLEFWKRLVSFTQIDAVDNYEMPVIMSFPNCKIFEEIESKNKGYIDKIPTLIHNDGWLFEFTKTVDQKKFPKYFEALKKYHGNIYHNIFNIDQSYLTLDEWIEFSLEFNNEINDIRLSEWTCLNIINNVIDFILTNRGEINLFGSGDLEKRYYIHPANIYLLKKDFEYPPKTWHEFKKLFNQTEIVLRKSEGQIYDERYMADKLLVESSWDNDLVLVNALGVLLAQILCNNFKFPWVWNQCDRSIIWSNQLIKQLSDNSISSYSKLIIQSCLNIRNKETIILTQRGVKAIDDSFDAPLIYKLEHLQANIRQVISILELNQISVESNMPRQLIPISLMQLSNKNNPFNI